MFLCYNCIDNRESVISMNRKGQALVEFVLILPIFIFILFAIVDFGMILNMKSELENTSVDIVNRFKNSDSLESIKSFYPDLSINFTRDDEYTVITISKDVDIMTPGLNLVLGESHMVTVERTIPNV